MDVETREQRGQKHVAGLCRQLSRPIEHQKAFAFEA
jgi:hypothetical protein